MKAAKPGAMRLAEADQEAEAEPELESGLRRCIVTRAVLPKAAMLRFVVAPMPASCLTLRQPCPDVGCG